MPPRPILPLIGQRLDPLLSLLKQDWYKRLSTPQSICRHQGRRALASSARACSSSALQPCPIGVQFGVAVGQGLQYIEHGGHIPRHADLIRLGMVSTPAPPGCCSPARMRKPNRRRAPATCAARRFRRRPVSMPGCARQHVGSAPDAAVWPSAAFFHQRFGSRMSVPVAHDRR